jgi:two-component system, NarL family, nitrate/nitrite response regulator NarL
MDKTAASCNVRQPGACHSVDVEMSVLIVDDNQQFLDVACALLERGGLQVAGVAATVGEALRQAERLRPDVVLIDIVLADESGFELARRLTQCDHSPRPAAILTSTHSEEDFADLIAASPVSGFLRKSELSAAAIRRVLSDN